MNFVTQIISTAKTPIEILLSIALAFGLGIAMVGEVHQEGGRIGVGHLLVRYAGIWLVVTIIIVVIFNTLGSTPAL